MSNGDQAHPERGSRLATGLSEAVFKSSRPKTIVVGPDAFALDRGSQGFGDDGRLIETVYDRLIDELVGKLETGERPHDSHDLFLATEIWLHRNGLDKHAGLVNIRKDFFDKYQDASLPLIDGIAALPFRYYINFGFDPYLGERVKQLRPRTTIFNIGIDELRERWSPNDRASDDAPWVINLLGRVGEAITTYVDLANLFSEVLQDKFLHDQMKREVDRGSVVYLGMQLRYWYTRILMLALRSETSGAAGTRRAFEMRTPALEAEGRCIELYSASTSRINMEVSNYERIRLALQRLVSEHKIKSVFISYRHEEEGRMKQIRKELSRRGDIVVTTSEDFTRDVGSEWSEIRTKAIENADVYLQLVTSSFHNNRSSDCWKELNIALDIHADDKRLIPIVFDGLDIENVEPRLAPIQSIRSDSSQWLERTLNKVASTAVRAGG